MTNNSTEEFDHISISLLFIPLWEHRKLILFLVLTSSIILGAYLIVKKATYSATVTLLPEMGTNRSVNLPFIPGLAGLGVGEMSEHKIVPDILRSHRLLGDLYELEFESDKSEQPLRLFEIWEMKDSGDTKSIIINKLRNNVIDYSENRATGLLSITVSSEDRKFCVSFANKLSKKLNEFFVNQKKSKASEQGSWINSRIEEVRKELTNKEEALRLFRERNVSIDGSPSLMLQQQRILRDLEITKEIFIELQKQLETFKIQELKELPSLQVLDSATVAVQGSGVSKIKTFFALTFAIFMTSVLLSYLFYWIKRSEDVNEIKATIAADLKHKNKAE